MAQIVFSVIFFLCSFIVPGTSFDAPGSPGRIEQELPSRSRPYYSYYHPRHNPEQQWDEVLAVINPNPSDISVRLLAYAKDGRLLGETSSWLRPQEHRLYSEADLAWPEETVAIKLESDSPLLSFIRLETRDRTRLVAVLPPSKPESVITIPSSGSGKEWGNQLVLLNTGSATANVELAAIDRDGNSIASAVLPNLLPMASAMIAVHDLFDPRRSESIRVIADQPLASLHFVKLQDQHDFFAFPVSSGSRTELLYPIFPGVSTIAGLVNELDDSVPIKIETYNSRYRSVIEQSTPRMLAGRERTYYRAGGADLLLSEEEGFFRVTGDRAIRGFAIIAGSRYGPTTTARALSDEDIVSFYRIAGNDARNIASLVFSSADPFREPAHDTAQLNSATAGGETQKLATVIPAEFEETLYVSGMNSVTAMSFAADGRLFVAEQTGKLRVIKNGVLLASPFVTVQVDSFGEGGMLGVAPDPGIETNGYVYVFYTAKLTSQNRVSRFTASGGSPDVADPLSELVILDNISNGNGYHIGGGMHFGTDGMLYVGVGDATGPINSQSLGSLAGKLLRIDPGSYPNIVPLDNPFVGTTGARGEIWALGLRNPFTFAVDPGTGKIMVNDVGGTIAEEVNNIVRGGNYGWPNCEGVCSNPSFLEPVYAYTHEGLNAAVTGGAFYNGTQFPAEYQGSYFFADYLKGFILRIKADNQVVSFATDAKNPVDLKVGPDGALYYLAVWDGAVYKIRYVPVGNRNPIASASATPTTGAAPLQVTFSGTGSSDPDGDALRYVWNFGDGSPTQQGAIVTHTYMQNGPYTAILTVEDGKGGSATASVKISVGNPPQGTITKPVEGTKYSAGDTIFYEGTATDPDDGSLPPSAFSWTILFHHLEHTHPFLGPIEGVTSGSFTIPKTGETDTNVWYGIYLTVKDSSGLTDVSVRDVLPRTSTITLASEPAGLQLSLDGKSRTAPQSVLGVVGMLRTLGAPSPQTLNGSVYEFSSWSDSGTATHTIEFPPTDTAYTATFNRTGFVTQQEVIWTNKVQVVATGNSIQSTGCNGCSAGAASAQSIGSGDGYLQFTAEETTTLRAAGLSNGDTDTSFSDIDFSIQLNPVGAGPRAYVRENGVYKTETAYAPGDVFQVAIEGGQVKYLRNGIVFYASTKAPVYPLLADASLADYGATIKNAIMSGNLSGGASSVPTISSVAASSITSSSATITWTTDEAADSQVVYGTTSGTYPNSSPLDPALVTSHRVDLSGLSQNTTYFYRVKSRNGSGALATSAEFTFTTSVGGGTFTTEAVVWTDAVDVAVTGNSIQSTGCAGCPAGAASAQSLVSGDGYVQFTAEETTTLRAAGLSQGNADTTFSDIDFGIQLNPVGAAAYAYVRENGIYKWEVPYVAGDVFRIAIEGGQVKYLRNGTVFYVSTKAPVYPLLIDASLADNGATIKYAVISGNLSAP